MAFPGRVMVWVLPILLVPVLEKEKCAMRSQSVGFGGWNSWMRRGGLLGSVGRTRGGSKAVMPDQRLVVWESWQVWFARARPDPGRGIEGAKSGVPSTRMVPLLSKCRFWTFGVGLVSARRGSAKRARVDMVARADA